VQGSRRTGAGALSNSGVSTSKGHREAEKIKKQKKENLQNLIKSWKKIPDSGTLKELIHSINQKED